MNQSSAINELREAIDACRPGSADLALPELARLAEVAARDCEVAAELARGERFDRLLAEALDDVPVPAGLAERLLANAAAQRLKTPIEDAVQSPEPAMAAPAVSLAATTVTPDAQRPTRRGLLWRWAAFGSISLAVATIALVVGQFGWGPAPLRVVSPQELLAEADSWMDRSTTGNVVWQPVTAAAPAGFAKPAAVVVRPQGWRSFRSGTGDAAVAYDLSVAGTRATLFVVATKARYPVGPLPYTTVPGATGGRQIAGWQSPTHLYLLVIDQGPPPEQYLRRPSVG